MPLRYQVGKFEIVFYESSMPVKTWEAKWKQSVKSQ